MSMPPMVEKFAVLDMLEDLREEVASDYAEGRLGPDMALSALIALHKATARVNALPVHLDLTGPLVAGRKTSENDT